MARILVVDDESNLREMTRLMLKRVGWEVSTAASGEQAVELLQAADESFDVVLTDLKMPGLSGLDVLNASQEVDASTQLVVMTAYASAETAVSAMKQGAYDYIEKPFKKDALTVLLQKALEKRQLLQENQSLKRNLARRTKLGKMVGRSAKMREIYDMIERVAPTRTNILITGESGTGKELVARAVHEHSTRSKGPFVPINCGAIPESLIESELFGHVKGAFTGAHKDKLGLFEAANGGTLFLDEVGELPKNTQVKLLRVLQERKIQRIGAVDQKAIDVRVVAATNRDLLEEVQSRRFREDLFYRLNVIHLFVPPLRDRGEDIPLLAQHFLQQFCEEQGRELKGIGAEALDILLAYTYPGNVRELENIIERAVTLERGDEVTAAVLPPSMRGTKRISQLTSRLELPVEGVDMEQTVEDVERALLLKALERTGGNRTEAAKLLGISFRSLRYRLDKYNMGNDT